MKIIGWDFWGEYILLEGLTCEPERELEQELGTSGEESLPPDNIQISTEGNPMSSSQIVTK